MSTRLTTLATRSRLPMDVVLDYNYHTGHLHNGAGAPLYPENRQFQETFFRNLRAAPPDLLVVGKEAPFTHSLGPIASYGGENQTFPSVGGKDDRRRLSPPELRLRIAAIRRFVADVHAAGVPRVAPYVSFTTLFGEPQQRIGFWEFLDHWDDYAAELDLGPKPAGDPIDWVQRDRGATSTFALRPTSPITNPSAAMPCA